MTQMSASCAAVPNPSPVGSNAFALGGSGLPAGQIVGVEYIDPSGAEASTTVRVAADGTATASFTTYAAGQGSAWFQDQSHPSRPKVLCAASVTVEKVPVPTPRRAD